MTILFAGNVGDAQDFESIIECARILNENKVSVVFSIVGNGRKFNWLQSEIKKYQLDDFFVLHGQHPLDMMPAFYSKADVALVSLKPNDIFERTIPGKIQSYMLSSLPILAMLDGEGKKLIDTANCGLSCSASDAYSLYENIKKISEMPLSERNTLGLNGKQYANSFFSKEKLVTRLEKTLNDALKVN
nr:glycosyltransferase [Aliivibrio fischeri]